MPIAQNVPVAQFLTAAASCQRDADSFTPRELRQTEIELSLADGKTEFLSDFLP